jgi:hypothetical protein
MDGQRSTAIGASAKWGIFFIRDFKIVVYIYSLGVSKQVLQSSPAVPTNYDFTLAPRKWYEACRMIW